MMVTKGKKQLVIDEVAKAKHEKNKAKTNLSSAVRIPYMSVTVPIKSYVKWVLRQKNDCPFLAFFRSTAIVTCS